MSLDFTSRSRSTLTTHVKPHSIMKSSSWLNPAPSGKRRFRTLYACEPCKRRKTKCSGRPCISCEEAGYTCTFNSKHDARSKAGSSSTTQDRQLYILNGVLQAIRHGSDASLTHLIQTLRQDRPHNELVDSLRSNLQLLQDRDIISKLTLEDADLAALAERSISGRLTWGQKSQRQGLYTITESDSNDILDHHHAVRLDSSSNVSNRLHLFEFAEIASSQSFSMPADDTNCSFPTSSRSSSVISPDAVKFMNLSHCESPQQLNSFNGSNDFPHPPRHTIYTPMNVIGDTKSYQHESFMYTYFEQPQYVHLPPYCIKYADCTNTMTLSDPSLLPLPPAYGAPFQQFCSRPTNPSALYPIQETLYAYQRAY